jgi:hypothetical protein
VKWLRRLLLGEQHVSFSVLSEIVVDGVPYLVVSYTITPTEIEITLEDKNVWNRRHQI